MLAFPLSIRQMRPAHSAFCFICSDNDLISCQVINLFVSVGEPVGELSGEPTSAGMSQPTKPEAFS